MANSEYDELTITITAAAKRLGAPKAVVQRVADELGLLIVFGNRRKIDPNDLQEIINACRNTQKAPVSTAVKTRASIKSATLDAGSVQRAQETAEKLKALSPYTSRKRTGQLVP